MIKEKRARNKQSKENHEDDYIRPLRGVCFLEPSPPGQRVPLRHCDLRLEQVTLFQTGAIDASMKHFAITIIATTGHRVGAALAVALLG
jgi:hypothetical protein